MMNISLRHLQTFLAVAASGSFRRASELMHLSQPAVTMQVQQLEYAIGIRLLDRTTRQVALTPEGERFRVRAERALLEIETIVGELRDEVSLHRGRLVIAALPTIAASLVSATLSQFKQLYPGITTRLHDPIGLNLDRVVESGQADLGIGPRPRDATDWDFRPLGRDPFVAVLPSTHCLAAQDTVSFEQLCREPFLAMSGGTNMGTVLNQGLERMGIILTPAYEVTHPYTLGGMVEAGLGVSALPRMAVGMMSHPSLRIVPIEPTIFREYGVITVRGRTASPAASAFIGVLEKLAATALA
jgi:LysR family carnitine catabolism transcriptional activator